MIYGVFLLFFIPQFILQPWYVQRTFELVLHFSRFLQLSSSMSSCGNSTNSLVLISLRQRGQRATSYAQIDTQRAKGKDGSVWHLNNWLYNSENMLFKSTVKWLLNYKPPAVCWGQHMYLLSADNLGDAGSAVNVGTVCDDGQADRVQTHRALFVWTAGQHQPQLLYQTLPQLCRRRCSTYRQNI